MELADIELSVLNRLFKATRGLYMRTLQTQYNLTAAVFFDLISSLKAKDFVRTEEDRVQITSHGIDYLVGHPKRNERKASSGTALSENFQGKKIGINEFYIPTKFEK
ncbi:MAG: hypothetical protein ACK487_00375 [Sphingomonadales bacterium]